MAGNCGQVAGTLGAVPQAGKISPKAIIDSSLIGGLLTYGSIGFLLVFALDAERLLNSGGFVGVDPT